MGSLTNGTSSGTRRWGGAVRLLLLCGLLGFVELRSAEGLFEPKEETVVVLTDNSIEDFIVNEEAALILFFAPWCHWSRELMTNFESAASMLKHQLAHVKFGKIDGTIHTKAMQEHSITVYPTLKMYVDGTEHEYTGGRHHLTIVKWVTEFLETEISITNREHLEETLSHHADSVIVIGGFDSASKHQQNAIGHTVLDAIGAPEKTFIKLSRAFVNLFFADVSDKDVINALIEKHHLSAAVKVPFMALINPSPNATTIGTDIFNPIFADEPKVIPYKGFLADFAAAKTFLTTYQFPLVIPFMPRSISGAFSDGRPLFALFVDKTHRDAAKHVAALKKAATRYRGKMLFIVAFTKDVFDQRLAGMVGANHDPLPTFRIFTVNPRGHHTWAPLLKFSPPESLRLSMHPDGIANFVGSYFKDELVPHLQSEPVPTEEDEGPVKHLVGLTFDKEVRRSNKDVFVVFSAPWCGHCRKLEPTLLVVGSKLRRHHNFLSISKIDATRNEVPGLSFSGYPSLMLFPAADKKRPLHYRGDRTADDMIRWLAANAHHKFDAEAIINDADGDDDFLLDSDRQEYLRMAEEL